MAMLKLNYGSDNKITTNDRVKDNGTMSFATDTQYLYFDFDGIAKPVKTPYAESAGGLTDDGKNNILNGLFTNLAIKIEKPNISSASIELSNDFSSNNFCLVFYNGLLLANDHYSFTNIDGKNILKLNFTPSGSDNIIQIIQIKNS